MAKYVLWGRYCDDVLEKRAPYRQAHLEGLQSQKDRGILLTIGPTEDLTQVFGLYEAESLDQVRELVKDDPYWRHGIWTEFEIKEWIQAL